MSDTNESDYQKVLDFVAEEVKRNPDAARIVENMKEVASHAGSPFSADETAALENIGGSESLPRPPESPKSPTPSSIVVPRQKKALKLAGSSTIEIPGGELTIKTRPDLHDTELMHLSEIYQLIAAGNQLMVHQLGEQFKTLVLNSRAQDERIACLEAKLDKAHSDMSAVVRALKDDAKVDKQALKETLSGVVDSITAGHSETINQAQLMCKSATDRMAYETGQLRGIMADLGAKYNALVQTVTSALSSVVKAFGGKVPEVVAPEAVLQLESSLQQASGAESVKVSASTLENRGETPGVKMPTKTAAQVLAMKPFDRMHWAELALQGKGGAVSAQDRRVLFSSRDTGEIESVLKTI